MAASCFLRQGKRPPYANVRDTTSKSITGGFRHDYARFVRARNLLRRMGTAHAKGPHARRRAAPHDSRKRSPPPTKTTEAYFRSCSATTSSDVSRAVRMASTMAWAVARVVQFVTR